MDQFSIEYIMVSVLYGMFVSIFFNGWRCYGVAVFVVAWQMLTPPMFWLKDIVFMFSAIWSSDIVFNIMGKFTANSEKLSS